MTFLWFFTQDLLLIINHLIPIIVSYKILLNLLTQENFFLAKEYLTQNTSLYYDYEVQAYEIKH